MWRYTLYIYTLGSIIRWDVIRSDVICNEVIRSVCKSVLLPRLRCKQFLWNYFLQCVESWLHPYQRIGINNRSPRSTFFRTNLLQILSPCVLTASPHPLLLLTSPRPPAVPPPPRHTCREDLEQFRTTESLAWASVINSYSLIPTDRQTSWGVLHHPYTVPVYKLLCNCQ